MNSEQPGYFGISEAAPFNGQHLCDLRQVEINGPGGSQFTNVSGGGAAGFGQNESLSIPCVKDCGCDGIAGDMPGVREGCGDPAAWAAEPCQRIEDWRAVCFPCHAG